ncbi:MULTISPECIES: TetR/AcrR family transcriptional regulator [Streptomycetaceae]|uniref:Transcriptional regulator, TetR family n=1 Tax=Streptantibioticus cattleyicolor (strain ATCC 35852 / DSM 46488 / JCM 4925 / NBRC 14057 / NRRL 8057) TaxID=1003195 RepID=F8JT91_STREN|nr:MULTISPECIES: TetR/AcrR family transcriptional regulator [Streptomycetaceae]AEW94240.1 transcriptional regulator, TetR family [Streptantibioticus cattleyicolor NRRL 8057 = DSM 46488]MYS58897.1 TetR family transcriptional regulator [Streptomyces sp. SID5468]CCB74594.1 putative Transcriptional regulator, tetR family [Streptantibioticus cattleyicolor NRRL 8057 = DSM 46488]
MTGEPAPATDRPAPATTRPARDPASARRRRAPRGSLNRERVLTAAVDLLDHAGPDAFTMRALATRLGVGTMAVYSHFRGKDEIVDAVRERLFGEVELPPRGSGATPREEARALCLAVYRLLAEHPSVLRLVTVRPVHGDEGTAVVDRLLGLMLRAGLGRRDAARAQTALMQYTVGSALWAARGRQAAACAPRATAAPGKPVDPGDSEEPGASGDLGTPAGSDRATRLRARLAALPAERYPYLTDLADEVAAAQNGRDHGTEQYEHGLDALLDGLLAGAGQG